MLRVRLSALLGERKLRISQVARETGINRGTLTRLYYESAERIELRDIEVLCSYLGCGVGDLIFIDQRKPDQGSFPSETSPLVRPLANGDGR